jgi:hypothetical protein
MESIYTQAVLDAKAVRASAMANAKAAIQEAFEPKIKAMLKKHIVESEEEEMDEAEHIVHTSKSKRAGLNRFKHAPAPKGAIEDLEEEYDEMEEGEDNDQATTAEVYISPSGEHEATVEFNGKTAKVVERTGEDLDKFWKMIAKAAKKMGATHIHSEENDPETESIEDILSMDEAEHIVHTNKAHRSKEAGYKHAPAHKGAIEDMEEGYDEMDEAEYASEMDEEDPGNLDEKYLDEILDELEEMDEAHHEEDDEEEDEMDEAKHHMDEAKKKKKAKHEEELDEHYDEMEEAKEEDEEEEDEDGKESEEDTKVVDVTLGDLVNAIKAAMAGHEGGEGHEAGDDEVSLDEILAELEDEGEEDDEEEDEMDEAKHHMEEAKKKMHEKKKMEEKKKMAEKKELEEAKKAIKLMQKELNEINLLNAKLLYVNKIFKSKSLTEAQKVKVLNAFDRATSVKEVKNTFKFISESITAAPKKQLKESFSGFASKPTGGAPKGNTLESDPFIARMQKLAGI